jgi:hypothetical protein
MDARYSVTIPPALSGSGAEIVISGSAKEIVELLHANELHADVVIRDSMLPPHVHVVCNIYTGSVRTDEMEVKKSFIVSTYSYSIEPLQHAIADLARYILLKRLEGGEVTSKETMSEIKKQILPAWLVHGVSLFPSKEDSHKNKIEFNKQVYEITSLQNVDELISLANHVDSVSLRNNTGS